MLLPKGQWNPSRPPLRLEYLPIPAQAHRQTIRTRAFHGFKALVQHVWTSAMRCRTSEPLSLQDSFGSCGLSHSNSSCATIWPWSSTAARRELRAGGVCRMRESVQSRTRRRVCLRRPRALSWLVCRRRSKWKQRGLERRRRRRRMRTCCCCCRGAMLAGWGMISCFPQSLEHKWKAL